MNVFFGRRLVCATLVLSLSATASTAFAEPPIGSRLGNRVDANKVGDERTAVQTAHALAACILVKHGSQARALLDSRDMDQVNKIRSDLFGEVECIGNIPGNDMTEGTSVTYPEGIFRGDLAEELLKGNERAVRALPALAIERTYSRPWFQFTDRAATVDEMSACVANTAPAAILALLQSPPLSDAENAALGNLIPAMGPCLVAGATLDAKREPLRASLAEALYQRVYHPEEGAAAAASSAAAR